MGVDRDSMSLDPGPQQHLSGLTRSRAYWQSAWAVSVTRGLAFARIEQGTEAKQKEEEFVDNDKVISTLNRLIETVTDGEEGFKTAAEGLTDPQTKALFLQYSRGRGEMARELQAEVRKIGGAPDQGGSVSGTLHRGWINIKSAVTGRNDSSIIAEAERGEDVAKKVFEEALNEPLPPSTRALVQQLAARVREAHDRVRSIEKAGVR
jgi:uncharacterized protein (TIGR02284 family)